MRFTIDPGHSYNVNKGVISGYYEGNAMFNLAVFLEEELKKYKDTEVMITRAEKENPTLEERGKFAASNGSTAFISLHTNSTSESEAASYVCGFYSVKRPESKVLCEDIVAAVTNVMKKSTTAKSRGALTKATAGVDYYGVIRHSVSGKSGLDYSFIIEHGFHTNKKQCEFLMRDENLKKIARAEAEVLARYFALELKTTCYFKIAVDNVFSSRYNAEVMIDRLKDSGLDAHIVETIPDKSIEDLAKEIINGLWGTGHTVREKNLRDKGWLNYYSYQDIRAKVNEICDRM